MYFLKQGLCFHILSVYLVAARVVELPQGRVRGDDLDNYFSFTNLRYAEPPMRFETAQPYERHWADIFNASGEIRNCVPFGRGTDNMEGSEDCLTLNVYTPRTADDHNRLPVFIYIHGGGFMFGSSSFYSPEAIMEVANMVVVTINYRLGPLGFLSTGDGLIQGNFGLKDQVLALRWIKRNIHFFGGDPERILLGGHSAGSASVHFHILRKETERLVSGAVGFSGSALNPWVMQLNAEGKVKTLANHLKCPVFGQEMKKCLQNPPVKDIQAAVLKMHYFLNYPFNIFGPVVESLDVPEPFIPDAPRNLICFEDNANVPFLVSFVTEDGVYNCGSLLQKNSFGIEEIEQLNNCWLDLAPHMLYYYDHPSAPAKAQISKSLRNFYMGGLSFSRSSYLRLQRMFTDVLYVNGIREMIELHRACGRNPVYGFVYANEHNYGVGNFLSNDTDFRFGAGHGDEIEQLLPLTLPIDYRMAKNDPVISKLMRRMLETFISTGVPHFGGQPLPANGNNGQTMQFLQIFQEKYCIGPWESYSYAERDCIECQCYKYPPNWLRCL